MLLSLCLERQSPRVGVIVNKAKGENFCKLLRDGQAWWPSRSWGKAGKDSTATSVLRGSSRVPAAGGRSWKYRFMGSPLGPAGPGFRGQCACMGPRLLSSKYTGGQRGGGNPGKVKGVKLEKELRYLVWSESNLDSKLAPSCVLCPAVSCWTSDPTF